MFYNAKDDGCTLQKSKERSQIYKYKMASSGEDGYGYDQTGDKEPAVSQQPGGLPPYSATQPMQGYPAPPQVGYAMPATSSSNAMNSSNTTVVMNQPQQPQQRQFVVPRNWGTGICDCFDDMSICLCGWFCGCCLAKQVAEDMGEHCCVPCCVPGWLTALRLKMRTQENIEGTLMNDCCTVAFCGPCALCQLARECKVVKMRRAAGMPMGGMQY